MIATSQDTVQSEPHSHTEYVNFEPSQHTKGINTQLEDFHIVRAGGSMLFTYLSAAVDPNSTSRIAAQVVSGIGFLGAGMILKGEIDKKITNLTTAASVWYSAAIGMAIGFNFYIIALAAVIFAVLVPRIPHITKIKSNREEED